MLQSLQVHNFALIEDAQVEFTRGLNILPARPRGQIDSRRRLRHRPGRTGVDFIVRSGTDEFRVQAVFDTEGDPRITALLREQDIDEEESLF